MIMASSTGTSSGSGSGSGSGSSMRPNSGSGSEEDLQRVMEQRKRKRMISNRESARRSRQRKQEHLDDLKTQVAQLRKENNQIITSMNVTTQHYLNVESENSILRAQVAELSHRLQSLTEMINLINATNVNPGCFSTEEHHQLPPQLPPQAAAYGVADLSVDGIMNSLWNYSYVSQQPIMACADMLQY